MGCVEGTHSIVYLKKNKEEIEQEKLNRKRDQILSDLSRAKRLDKELELHQREIINNKIIVTNKNISDKIFVGAKVESEQYGIGEIVGMNDNYILVKHVKNEETRRIRREVFLNYYIVLK